MSSMLVRSVSNAMRRTRLTCSGNSSRNCASSASIFSFKQATNGRLAFGQAMAEPRCREDEGVLLGVETNRGTEYPSVRFDVGGSAVRQHDLAGIPVRTAQSAHDVDRSRHGAGTDLVRRFGAGLIDRVVEDRELAVDDHVDRRASQVVVEEAHQAVQRGADIGRVLREQSHQAERMQPALRTDQQAEMRAARQLGAAGDQAASCGKRDRVVRIVEQRKIESRLPPAPGRDRRPGCGSRRARPKWLRHESSGPAAWPVAPSDEAAQSGRLLSPSEA